MNNYFSIFVVLVFHTKINSTYQNHKFNINLHFTTITLYVSIFQLPIIDFEIRMPNLFWV